MSLYNVMAFLLTGNEFNCMFEKDIFQNHSPQDMGVLKGVFMRVWVSKWHPGALLAKTMLDRLVT